MDALENIAFNHFSAGVRLYRFVMCYEHTPKSSPSAAHASARAKAGFEPARRFGVQRADLFTVALLGIARCGKTGSAGPLLRHDAAGQQQHCDDEQGAGHAEAFAGLRRPTRLSAETMLSSVFKLGEWVCC
jgi:hypothetical protein